MDCRMDGRVALVTGSSRGLGRAMALEFAASGAHVCIVARREDVLNETREEVDAAGEDGLDTGEDAAVDDDALDEVEAEPVITRDVPPPVQRKPPWQVMLPYLVKTLVLANYPVRFLPSWAQPMVDWVALSLVFWVPVIWVLVFFVLT